MSKRLLQIPLAPIRDRNWLLAAAIYNTIWALWVGIFPEHYFNLISMPQPNYIGIWQCIGMFVGVFGIGYAIAALDPYRYWPIILVGFMGKVLGPLGFFYQASIGLLPLKFGLITLTNDFIWLYPFFRILKEYYLIHLSREVSLENSVEIIQKSTDQKGSSNFDLLDNKKVAFVFLRHLGCTFCRELTDKISKKINIIEKSHKVVFVHGETHEIAKSFFENYNVSQCTRISDPQSELYRAVGLSRGSFLQLFGIKQWVRGFVAGVLQGYGVGWADADPLMMHGIVVFDNGVIVLKSFPQTASDLPSIESLTDSLEQALT
jgi:hypothetical protein